MADNIVPIIEPTYRLTLRGIKKGSWLLMVLLYIF